MSVLVLSRKAGQSLRIGEDVRITVVALSGGQVRLAVEAPARVTVHREEVFERIARANREAARSAGDPSLLLERLGGGDSEERAECPNG